MIHFCKRVGGFLRRTLWLGTLMGTPFAAALFLIRARGSRKCIGLGRYQGMGFSFRGQDLSALKEVLIDAEYAFLRSFLKNAPAPVILDIGAHVGTFALWSLGENPKAQILSVEADPKTFEILSATVARNQNRHWTCINNAAWKNTDSIRFSDTGDSMSHRVSGEGTVEVRGVPLPEIMAKTGASEIDLMKVDIEGAEEAFLCAYPEALGHIKALVIELHPALCDTARVREVLSAHFSVITEIQGRISSKPLLYCRK